MRHGARDYGQHGGVRVRLKDNANSDLLVTPLDFRIVVYSSERQQLY